MKVYRSIDPIELKLLCVNKKVQGQFNCAEHYENSCNHNNVICCFTEPFRFFNGLDNITIVLDVIPDDEICDVGYGTYNLSPSVLNTKVVNVFDILPKSQTLDVAIEEIYLKEYSLSNVRAIYLNTFNDNSFTFINELERMAILYGFKIFKKMFEPSGEFLFDEYNTFDYVSKNFNKRRGTYPSDGALITSYEDAYGWC